jgi:hypothetical protein
MSGNPRATCEPRRCGADRNDCKVRWHALNRCRLAYGAEECREAFDALKPDLRAALELAAQRIPLFTKQLPEDRD